MNPYGRRIDITRGIVLVVLAVLATALILSHYTTSCNQVCPEGQYWTTRCSVVRGSMVCQPTCVDKIEMGVVVTEDATD